MFNLIPDNLKATIIREYSGRRLIVWFAGFTMLCIALYVFLLPTYIHVVFEEKDLLNQTELLKDSAQFKKADDIVRVITETNEQLRVVSTPSYNTTPVSAIEKIILSKNTNIRITDIQYIQPAEQEETKVSIAGIANTRDSLRQFVSSLEEVEVFSEVTLPVSNFAKDRDIDFLINLTVK